MMNPSVRSVPFVVGASRKPEGLPVDDHKWADGVAATFGAIDGQAALRDGVARHKAAQAEVGAVAVGEDALQQFAFDVGVSKVTVSSFAAAPVAQDAAGVVRMVAQSGIVNANAVE